MTTEREMPKYKCTKEVHALQIKMIVMDSIKANVEKRETDGSAMITPVEDGYADFRVDYAYMSKHTPVVGGYYVVYEGGYKSFSPAEPFDNGYVKI